MLRFIRNNSTSSLLKTPLYDSHVKYSAKFVPYAGFEMPILYKGLSHIDSHKFVRTNVGLFDVSHMLQHTLKGKESIGLLQKMTPIDLSLLQNNSSSLSVLLNETGGIIDDCIITKVNEEEYYMVTNAGCREKDIEFIKTNLANYSVDYKNFEGTLLAVQGPKSSQILSKYCNYNFDDLKFGNMVRTKLSSLINTEIQISRTGYTGEDGFELSIPSSTSQEIGESNDFFQSLIEEQPDVVQPIGLAARDSLRLEAGMCLYGNDLTESITPIESSLTWLIPKTRRNITNEAEKFNGYDKIIEQINNKKSVPRRRIGITSKGPAPRSGSKILDPETDKEIGYVSSGLLSPILGHNIGQAYIDKTFKIGSTVNIDVRGKKREGIVTKLPFVANNFYK